MSSHPNRSEKDDDSDNKDNKDGKDGRGNKDIKDGVKAKSGRSAHKDKSKTPRTRGQKRNREGDKGNSGRRRSSGSSSSSSSRPPEFTQGSGSPKYSSSSPVYNPSHPSSNIPNYPASEINDTPHHTPGSKPPPSKESKEAQESQAASIETMEVKLDNQQTRIDELETKLNSSISRMTSLEDAIRTRSTLERTSRAASGKSQSERFIRKGPKSGKREKVKPTQVKKPTKVSSNEQSDDSNGTREFSQDEDSHSEASDSAAERSVPLITAEESDIDKAIRHSMSRFGR